MKAFSKQWLAAAGLALSGASAFAAHVAPSGITYGTTFTVTPSLLVVGLTDTPRAAFDADLINFRYGARVDQPAGVAGDPVTGVGATGTFTEVGGIQFGPFFLGTTQLGAGGTGLGLGPPGTDGYLLYALFQSSGDSVTTDASPVNGMAADTVNGTFRTFEIQFFVDANNNTTFTQQGVRGGPILDDTNVLNGTLIVGGFHTAPGLVNGDFDVEFRITDFGLPGNGFFSTNITAGDLRGNNDFLSPGVALPPAAFANQTITGSGNVIFAAVPEPTSMALVGLALAGLGLSRRKARGG